LGLIDTLITDGNLPLPQLLRRYRLRYPLVELNVQTRTTAAIEQSLLDGSLDVGLIVGRRRITQLDYRLLYREQNRLYCCPEHPLYQRDDQTLSIEDIREFDYAGYSFVNEIDQSGPARFLRKSATADSVEAMAALVSSGCFIGVLPEHYVRSVWRLRTFKALMPEVFSISTAIEFITRHAVHPPRVVAFLELLAAAEDGADAPLHAAAPGAAYLDAPANAGSPLDVDVGPGVTH
jgi:DNA-binding transcriptional LysR family regulator